MNDSVSGTHSGQGRVWFVWYVWLSDLPMSGAAPPEGDMGGVMPPFLGDEGAVAEPAAALAPAHDDSGQWRWKECQQGRG